jgi:branched-chain amino acid transport system substrate-binding protein
MALLGAILFFGRTPSEVGSIKVGLAVGLSGYAANWGEGEVRAVELAYEAYKERLPRVELIIEDTKSDGLGTVNAMQKLIQSDRVVAVIGPTWGDSFQGGYPLAESAQVVVISPSAALEAVEHKSDFSFLFSTWWPQRLEADAIINDMHARGVQKVCVVHDHDPFNTIFSTFIIEQSKLATARFEVGMGTADFRTDIAKIKKQGCDTIFAAFQDTSAIGPFMSQLKEQDVTVQVYSSTSAQNEENLQKFPGSFDGLLYSFPDYATDPAYRELQTELHTKYGEDAVEGPAFVNAYNAASMLFAVLVDGARTGEEIRLALSKKHLSAIGTEDLYFNEQGQIGDISFVIKTVRNNAFVEL